MSQWLNPSDLMVNEADVVPVLKGVTEETSRGDVQSNKRAIAFQQTINAAGAGKGVFEGLTLPLGPEEGSWSQVMQLESLAYITELTCSVAWEARCLTFLRLAFPPL